MKPFTPKRLKILYLLIFYFICISCQDKGSLFDSIGKEDKSDKNFRFKEENNVPVSTNDENNNLEKIIENLRSKITNPVLKEKLNTENISNFLNTFFTGNEYISNLEVNDFTTANKLEVLDLLNVKGEAKFNQIHLKSNFRNKIMNITDNEIIFEPEAKIKIKNSPIEFKTKDIFEVISFLKYIINICGNKMEKCDFNMLLKSRINDDREKLKKVFKDSIKKVQNALIIDSNNTFPSNSTTTKLNSNKLKLIKDNLNSKENQVESFMFKEDPNLENKIELDLENEFKKYKNSANDYENFLGSPLFQTYVQNYYYGI